MHTNNMAKGKAASTDGPPGRARRKEEKRSSAPRSRSLPGSGCTGRRSMPSPRGWGFPSPTSFGFSARRRTSSSRPPCGSARGSSRPSRRRRRPSRSSRWRRWGTRTCLCFPAGPSSWFSCMPLPLRRTRRWGSAVSARYEKLWEFVAEASGGDAGAGAGLLCRRDGHDGRRGAGAAAPVRRR